jgi:hypothetical protein
MKIWALLTRLHSFPVLVLAAMIGLAACTRETGAGEEARTPAQSGTVASSETISTPPRETGQEPTSQSERNVVINDTRLPDAIVRDLESNYRVQFRDGRYWYDKMSGAWGLEGGPCVGFGVPGLVVAGPLRSNASNGNTGIFVNGRELHQQDAIGIQTSLGVPPQPGRYWWDAYGNVGYEGEPALFNVRQVLAARGGSQSGGAWSHHSAYGPTSSGSVVGGDGQGFFYYQDGKTSYTSGN